MADCVVTLNCRVKAYFDVVEQGNANVARRYIRDANVAGTNGREPGGAVLEYVERVAKELFGGVGAKAIWASDAMLGGASGRTDMLAFYSG